MGLGKICSQMMNLYIDVHLLSCFLWFLLGFVKLVLFWPLDGCKMPFSYNTYTFGIVIHETQIKCNEKQIIFSKTKKMCNGLNVYIE